MCKVTVLHCSKDKRKGIQNEESAENRIDFVGDTSRAGRRCVLLDQVHDARRRRKQRYC